VHFMRKCETLARQINRRVMIPIRWIHYEEYLHNVYYEAGVGYCKNQSERRINCSDIEICKYKGRIKVIMLAMARIIPKRERRAINKILRTNVQYKDLKNGYTEISFNVNPHKM